MRGGTHRGDILRAGMQNVSYIVGENNGVGVRYINASIPIYIGEILGTPTQNLFYIRIRGMHIQLV